jgi:hypothetical protein
VATEKSGVFNVVVPVPSEGVTLPESFHIAMPGSEEKKQESKDAQKVMRRLAQRLKRFGFDRTKPTFFTRSRPCVIEFVHVHKYTFGPDFRIHLGISVKNEEHPGTLNGPMTNGKHNFRYSSEEASFEICAQAMAEYVGTEGLEWFDRFADPLRLLSASDSPLRDESKAALEMALRDPSLAVCSAATRVKLGVERASEVGEG